MRVVLGANLFIYEPVHVLVTRLVGLFYFVVKKFTVIATEPSVSASHSDNFIDHVQSVFGQLSALVLTANNRLSILVLGCLFVK